MPCCGKPFFLPALLFSRNQTNIHPSNVPQTRHTLEAACSDATPFGLCGGLLPALPLVACRSSIDSIVHFVGCSVGIVSVLQQALLSFSPTV